LIFSHFVTRKESVLPRRDLWLGWKVGKRSDCTSFGGRIQTKWL